MGHKTADEARDDFDEWTSLYGEFYPPGSRADVEFRASRLLVMAGRSWVYRIDNLLRAETGQTRARWQVLFTMAFAEQPVTMTEIAARLKVQWPTMARVVEGMERDGLLERQDNPADGRSKLLHLTPSGTALIERIQPILDRERAHLLAGLSEDDLKTCADLLHRIFEAAIAR
jgi:MarR family transcriptional regulator for hemolysin